MSIILIPFSRQREYFRFTYSPPVDSSELDEDGKQRYRSSRGKKIPGHGAVPTSSRLEQNRQVLAHLFFHSPVLLAFIIHPPAAVRLPREELPLIFIAIKDAYRDKLL
jgi:hypothetical protein